MNSKNIHQRPSHLSPNQKAGSRYQKTAQDAVCLCFMKIRKKSIFGISQNKDNLDVRVPLQPFLIKLKTEMSLDKSLRLHLQEPLCTCGTIWELGFNELHFFKEGKLCLVSGVVSSTSKVQHRRMKMKVCL